MGKQTIESYKSRVSGTRKLKVIPDVTHFVLGRVCFVFLVHCNYCSVALPHMLWIGLQCDCDIS